MRAWENEFSASEGVWGDLHTVRDPDGTPRAYHGAFATPEGMVKVDIYPTDNGGEEIHFRTVLNGRDHMRTEERSASQTLTERGAKIAAHRWIKRITAR